MGLKYFLFRGGNIRPGAIGFFPWAGGALPFIKHCYPKIGVLIFLMERAQKISKCWGRALKGHKVGILSLGDNNG